MNVAVVGGGITGLTAAHALIARGDDAVVFEHQARLGGKLRTETIDGFLVEAGPDSFLSIGPEMRALCAAVGIDVDLVGLRPPRRVFVHGRGALHPLPSGVRLTPTRWLPVARSGLLTWREKIRVGFDLVRPAETIVGDVSIGALVRRRFGAAALDRLTAPLIGGIYAADPDRLSAGATFPHLLDAARQGSMMVAMRKGPRPAAEFLSLAGGMESLIEALAASIGRSDINTGIAVRRIVPTESGVEVETDHGRCDRFDATIIAVAPTAAASIVRDAAPEAAAELDAIEHVSTVVVSLGYAASETPPLRGHGFVVARDQVSAITACSWSSSKWDDRAPTGHVLVRAFMGSAERPVDLDLKDDVLVDLARQALSGAMGLDATPVLARVHRWPAAMPQYAVGHLARVERIERALRSRGRIVVAGAGYRGVGIARCVRQASEAVSSLHSRTGTTERSGVANRDH